MASHATRYANSTLFPFRSPPFPLGRAVSSVSPYQRCNVLGLPNKGGTPIFLSRRTPPGFFLLGFISPLQPIRKTYKALSANCSFVHRVPSFQLTPLPTRIRTKKLRVLPNANVEGEFLPSPLGACAFPLRRRLRQDLTILPPRCRKK